MDEPLTAAVNCCVLPNCRSALAGETDTVTPELRVTGTFAADVPLACAMHVTVTVVGVENLSGAVYRPLLEIVPTVEFPPTTLSTSHITFVFAFPDSSQVNCTVPPNPTIAVVGVIFTVMVPGFLEGLPPPLPPQETPQKTPTKQTSRKGRDLTACRELPEL
jgi:hypothetical protein